MTQPDRATILDAYDDEFTKRRKYWIGGVPEQGDLRGIRQHVARTLGVTPQDVAAALAARREVARAQ